MLDVTASLLYSTHDKQVPSDASIQLLAWSFSLQSTLMAVLFVKVYKYGSVHSRFLTERI
jgi:hypothetical protein